MDLKRQLRHMSKLRAKKLIFKRLGSCLAAAVLTCAVSLLGNYAAGFVLPDYGEFVYAPDMTVYLPRFALYYAITLSIMFFTAPLSLAFYAWLSELSMLRPRKVSGMFQALGDVRFLLKSFGAALWYFGICVLWGIFFLAVPLAAMLYTVYNTNAWQNAAYATALLLLVLLIISGTVMFLIRVLSYLPAFYVIASHPGIKVSSAFRECDQYMAGRRTEFLTLTASFILWFLAESMSYGILSIFVKPYFSLTVLSFTQQARGVWLRRNMKPEDGAWTPEPGGEEE